MNKKSPLLWLEMFLLYLFLPGIYLISRETGPRIPFLIPLLIAVSYCWIVLRRDSSFNRKEYGWNGFKSWKKLLLYWLVYVIISTIAIWVFTPDLLFNLPKTNPLLTLMIWIFYPIWSVLPQELYYRTFFIHRYEHILPKAWLIFVNGALFGLVHILFGSWVSVILSFFLGCWLAWRYLKYRSLLVSSLEHGLYGNWVFTVGLGQYFYRPV